MFPEIRNLDSVYFRVCRNGAWCDICYTDLTEAEREEVTQNRPADWWRGLANILADQLRYMGDTMDLTRRV